MLEVMSTELTSEERSHWCKTPGPYIHHLDPVESEVVMPSPSVTCGDFRIPVFLLILAHSLRRSVRRPSLGCTGIIPLIWGFYTYNAGSSIPERQMAVYRETSGPQQIAPTQQLLPGLGGQALKVRVLREVPC